jgi:methyl-accepting chemotaxis protein
MNSFRLFGGGIGARLAGAFAALLVLLLLCAGFSVAQLRSLHQSVENVAERAQATVLAAGLVSDAHETSGALGRAVMSDTIEGTRSGLQQAEKLADETKAEMQALTGLTHGETGTLKEVQATEAQYRAAMAKVAAAIKGGDGDAARLALNDKVTIAAEAAYLQALAKLNAEERKAAAAAREHAASAYATGRNLLIAVAIVGAALAIALGLLITRSLTAPAAQAVSVATRIAAGDLTQDVKTVGRGDEMGRMLEALQTMQASLRRTVSAVRENADGVASASVQIAQGNAELSRRTESQASALEETAATMSQLGATVRNNADNARQTNQLALSASEVAIQGGSVVGEVVETMKGINDSSKKIAEIIGVIDGIAFQTNILALNAAVEAARAGEQGRGFAVVAGEVRNLAQRSAEAAREIKALISVSVGRVEQGSALVDKAGATMQEVVASIRRVTDIMGEISAASVEQSNGVAQVEQAVTQMDQMTQQNAALVEESAAAAENLKAQAEQMVQAVAVFKLSEGARQSRAAVSRRVVQPKWQGAERRGPNRAGNVKRPDFGAAKTADGAPSTAAPPAKTGTDDWTTF